MRLGNKFGNVFGQSDFMSERLKRLLGFGPAPKQVHPTATREPVTHVVIIDGTMSRLDEGYETHAGTVFRMLSEMAPNRAVSLKYEQGIQSVSYTHLTLPTTPYV